MKSHAQIKKMVMKEGRMMEAYKEVRLYGVIVRDKEFTVDKGFYAGHNRVMEIEHHKRVYNVEMLNGDVRVFGWNE